MSERDFDHLSECYEAYGLGASITNGHLTGFDYDNKELNEASQLIKENVRKIERIYSDMLNNNFEKELEGLNGG